MWTPGKAYPTARDYNQQPMVNAEITEVFRYLRMEDILSILELEIIICAYLYDMNSLIIVGDHPSTFGSSTDRFPFVFDTFCRESEKATLTIYE